MTPPGLTHASVTVETSGTAPWGTCWQLAVHISHAFATLNSRRSVISFLQPGSYSLPTGQPSPSPVPVLPGSHWISNPLSVLCLHILPHLSPLFPSVAVPHAAQAWREPSSVPFPRLCPLLTPTWSLTEAAWGWRPSLCQAGPCLLFPPADTPSPCPSLSCSLPASECWGFNPFFLPTFSFFFLSLFFPLFLSPASLPPSLLAFIIFTFQLERQPSALPEGGTGRQMFPTSHARSLPTPSSRGAVASQQPYIPGCIQWHIFSLFTVQNLLNCCACRLANYSVQPCN